MTTQTPGTTETQRRFAQAWREKKELDDRVNMLKDELSSLQEPLLNYFADAGEESKTLMAEAPTSEAYELLREILSRAVEHSLADDAYEAQLAKIPSDLRARIERMLAPARINLHIHSQLWANTKEGSTPEQACDALIAGGLDKFVAPRFNTQTLSAYVRELADKGEELPKVTLAHVSVANKIEIRGRRA